MRYRLLGGSGLRVSELFLGTMTYQDPDTLDTMVGRYHEAGGNVIDTASAYGDSETDLGRILGSRRDQLVLATKYTLRRDGADLNSGGNHRRSLRRSLDRSLSDLRTDHVDLLWVHVWDPRTPIDETMRALDDEVRAGRVLYVGISDAPAWVIARANTLAEWRGWSPFVGVQVPYSLRHRDIERDTLEMAHHLGLSIAAWGPLAGGLLSGRYLREGATGRLDASSLTTAERALAQAVVDVAADIGATPSQVATAWTRSHAAFVHPIIGPRTVAQLDDALGSVDVELDGDAVAALEAAAPFDAGYLHDFIASCHDHPGIYGDAVTRLASR